MAEPMRNPFNILLPPWRFGSNVRSAGDAEVDRLSDGAVLAEWCFAALVILGVLGEFVIASINPPHDSRLGHLGPAFADLMVAVGVAGEVIASMVAHKCSSVLLTRSNESLAELWFWRGFAETQIEETSENLADAHRKLAKAIERAASLEKEAAAIRLELERQVQKQAPRSLSKEQCEILRTLKGKAPAVTIVSSSSAEARAFASTIEMALLEADVAVMVGHANPGQIWTGVRLWLPDQYLIDRDNHPLVKTLRAAGLCNLTGPIAGAQMAHASTDFPIIALGDKPVEFKDRVLLV